MAITDESRYHLHQRLEEVLGAEQAATLMAHLPPVGWADVATRRDLDALEQRMSLRIEALSDRLDAVSAHLSDRFDLKLGATTAELRHEFQRDLRVAMLGSAGVFAGVIGLIQAASRII